MILIIIGLYFLVGLVSARVARRLYPGNQPSKLAYERHEDFCCKSLAFDIKYGSLSKKYGSMENRICEHPGLCKVKWSNPSDENDIKVVTTFFVWPIMGLAWFLLTDRIFPERLSEAQKLQKQLDSDPIMKKIYDELMEKSMVA